MKLWDRTAFAEFAREMNSSKPLKIAYFMGHVDSAIFDLFGVLAESDEAPIEAKECAVLMLNACACEGAERKQLMMRAYSIARTWRASREVH